MPRKSFSHVAHWVFDLDNTLYPSSARLFDQIEVNMTRYVMDALKVERETADHLRRHYWAEYGTTLAGLMREHGVDPTPYLTHVHEIDMSHLTRDHDLRSAISALPGRKIVYTNGSAPYAERVLDARGLEGIFDAIYGVEHADFHPKPERQAFELIFEKDGVETAKGAMFEDDPRNLAVPADLGMKTVHVAPSPVESDHIHHHTDDLASFIKNII
ncbi:MAG: pyrimidine 5'-nucleotidase [Rhodobacterales bacterium]|nr:MAG: pyrimidine 5'-nucleotidase [Rhodobacterales bacterium]